MLSQTHLHWLKPAFPEARWLHLSPAGGERFGELLVVSVPASELPDLDAATVVLWKLRLCVVEELPYEAWDDAMVGWLRGLGLHHGLDDLELGDFAGVPPGDEHLGTLRRHSEAVLAAQASFTPLVNPLREGPTPGSGGSLARLLFLRPEALRRKLRDEWNDITTLFEHDGQTVLAHWDTSA